MIVIDLAMAVLLTVLALVFSVVGCAAYIDYKQSKQRTVPAREADV